MPTAGVAGVQPRARDLLREAGAGAALLREACQLPHLDRKRPAGRSHGRRGSSESRVPAVLSKLPGTGRHGAVPKHCARRERARGRVPVEDGELAARGEVDALSVCADVDVIRTCVGDERRAIAAGSPGRVAAFHSRTGSERPFRADIEEPEAGEPAPNAPDGGVEMASAWAELDVRSLKTGRQRDTRSGRRGRVAGLEVGIAVGAAGRSRDDEEQDGKGECDAEAFHRGLQASPRGGWPTLRKLLVHAQAALRRGGFPCQGEQEKGAHMR